ncbi:MAG: RIP metalloprotease RseP [Pseudomonadota bacterium]|nr:MAG: RIP metalloprotease RseP [Pseudomonadota bacterium]
MLDFLFIIAAFLVAITVLIAVHEFGHFWVAKRLGVKVLRYSIGFGKPLWRRRFGPDQTEYVVAALPLGGYVKMLDEREGDVAKDELPRAFNRQSLATRFAVVSAGPAFNFLFAIIAYWLMFMIGVSGIKPVLGEVVPSSPAAAAGLASGDEIVAVAGDATPIWHVAIQKLLPALIDRGQVTLSIRDGSGLETTRELNLESIDPDTPPERFLNAIGFVPWRPLAPPTVYRVLEDRPAAAAGFKDGDRILSIDGVEMRSSSDLVDYVSARPGQPLEVVVERAAGGREALRVTPRRESDKDGREVGRIGLIPVDAGEFPEEMKADYRYSVVTGLGEGLKSTWNNSMLTLKMLGKIVIGEASLKNLSGPINIARYAGQSASAGLPWYLSFLAIVSISLGIINLLPIPILDGGHLMYYIIEFFKGSPVSEQFEAVAQRLGIVVIAMLMSLAFYNDLARIFG